MESHNGALRWTERVAEADSDLHPFMTANGLGLDVQPKLIARPRGDRNGASSSPLLAAWALAAGATNLQL
jgi:hypothetical protein